MTVFSTAFRSTCKRLDATVAHRAASYHEMKAAPENFGE